MDGHKVRSVLWNLRGSTGRLSQDHERVALILSRAWFHGASKQERPVWSGFRQEISA